MKDMNGETSNERIHDFYFMCISINRINGVKKVMSEEVKFEVVDRNGKYSVTGFDGFSIKVDNRFDAVQLCGYLNGQDQLVNDYRERWISYYTVLTKIRFIVDDIHKSSGEIHILEKAIKIKNLLKGVL